MTLLGGVFKRVSSCPYGLNHSMGTATMRKKLFVITTPVLALPVFRVIYSKTIGLGQGKQVAQEKGVMKTVSSKKKI